MHVDRNEAVLCHYDNVIPVTGHNLVWKYEPDVEHFMKGKMLDDIDDCNIQWDTTQYWTTSRYFRDNDEV